MSIDANKMLKVYADITKTVTEVRRNRPDLLVPAGDVGTWNTEDLQRFSDVVRNQYEPWATAVDDMVDIFLMVAEDRQSRGLSAPAPVGLGDAIQARDLNLLDRMMTAVMDQNPDLFDLKAAS